MSKELDRLLQRRDQLTAELAEVRLLIKEEQKSLRWTGRLKGRAKYIIEAEGDPSDVATAQKVATLGREHFLYQYNVSQKTVGDIENYLQSHGLEWETLGNQTKNYHRR
jgi:hypothetical protein